MTSHLSENIVQPGHIIKDRWRTVSTPRSAAGPHLPGISLMSLEEASQTHMA